MASEALPANDAPIVIAGAPRSGVRLLAAILGAHTALACGPELPFIVTMAQQWHDIESTLGGNLERHHGVTREHARRSFRDAIVSLLTPRAEDEAGHPRRVVIHSFAAAAALDTFGALFPAARFILMVRDPRAVACSLLERDWRNPRDGAPLPYTRDASAAGRMWMQFVQAASMSARRPELESRAMWLRYEDLCMRAGETLHRLGDFLGVAPLQPRVPAASAAIVTRSRDYPHPPLRSGPIDGAAVLRWTSELSDRQRIAVEAAAGPARRQLGYG